MTNFFDFGIKGDGVAFDSAGLQAWINQCGLREGSLDPLAPAMLPSRSDYVPDNAVGAQFKAKYQLDRPLLIPFSTMAFGTGNKNGASLIGPSQFPLIHVAPAAIAGPSVVPSLVSGPGSAWRCGPTWLEAPVEKRNNYISLRELYKAADLDGLNTFTFECFFKLHQDIGSAATLFASSGQLNYGEPVKTAFILGWVNSNRPRLTIRTTTGVYILDATEPVVVNVVHHLAATFNAGRMCIWLDGNLIGEKTVTGAIVQEPFEDVTLGTQILSFPEVSGMISGPNATIDSVRLSSVARYTAPFTPPATKHTYTWPASNTGIMCLLNFAEVHGPFVRVEQEWPVNGGKGCWVESKSSYPNAPCSHVNVTNLFLLGGSMGISARRAVSLSVANVTVRDTRGVAFRIRDNSFMSSFVGCFVQNAQRGAFWIASASGLTQIERCNINSGVFPVIFADNQMSVSLKSTYLGASAPHVSVLVKDAGQGMVVTLEDFQHNDELMSSTSNRMRTVLMASGIRSLNVKSCAFYSGTRHGQGLANTLPSVVLDNVTTSRFESTILEPDQSAASQVQFIRPLPQPAIFAAHRDPSSYGVPLTTPDKASQVLKAP